MLVSANNLSERGGHRAALGKNSKIQALVAPRREPLSFDREPSGQSTQTTKGGFDEVLVAPSYSGRSHDAGGAPRRCGSDHAYCQPDRRKRGSRKWFARNGLR